VLQLRPNPVLPEFCDPSAVEKELLRVVEAFQAHNPDCVHQSRVGESVCLLIWPRLPPPCGWFGKSGSSIAELLKLVEKTKSEESDSEPDVLNLEEPGGAEGSAGGARSSVAVSHKKGKRGNKLRSAVRGVQARLSVIRLMKHQTDVKSPQYRVAMERKKMCKEFNWWMDHTAQLKEPIAAAEFWRRLLWPILFGRGAFASELTEARLRQVRFKACWEAILGLLDDNPHSDEALALMHALMGPELPPAVYRDPREQYREKMMEWAAKQVTDLTRQFRVWNENFRVRAFDDNDGVEAKIQKWPRSTHVELLFVDEPLSDLWTSTDRPLHTDRYGRTVTALRVDARLPTDECITHMPITTPAWVNAKDCDDAVLDLQRAGVPCQFFDLQNIGDPARGKKSGDFDERRVEKQLKGAEAMVRAELIDVEAGNLKSHNEYKRFREKRDEQHRRPKQWGNMVRRYTRAWPGIEELHTFWLHAQYAARAEDAVQLIKERLQKALQDYIWLPPNDPRYQTHEVMHPTEIWRRARAILEMLNVCDPGWVTGTPKWSKKLTPAGFIRDIISFRLVLDDLEHVHLVLRASEQLHYDTNGVALLGARNDFHTSAPRPPPNNACVRLWFSAGVRYISVLVELQVHIGERWNALRETGIPLALLEGRLDWPWVKDWRAPARACASAIDAEQKAASVEEDKRQEERARQKEKQDAIDAERAAEEAKLQEAAAERHKAAEAAKKEALRLEGRKMREQKG
jgi:hypothetical protein